MSSTYIPQRPIGKGAYGTVQEVRHAVTGETFAIKRLEGVFQSCLEATRLLRELRLLRAICHENITKIHEVLPPSDPVGFNVIFIVYEHMSTDLYQVIRSNQPLTSEHIRFFMFQLLAGLSYAHAANVLHRDLNPSNLLVNADCTLKICDFGLARSFDRDAEMSDYVVTRWYRCPELLLGARNYDFGVDIWAVGCILAEMLGRRAIFPGRDPVHQLSLICKVVGTPREEKLQHLPSKAARTYVQKMPQSERVDLALLYPDAGAQGVDLLDRLLQFTSRDRPSAAMAMEHSFVRAYARAYERPPPPPPFTFEYDGKMEDTSALRRLVYNEIMTHYRAPRAGQAAARTATPQPGGGVSQGISTAALAASAAAAAASPPPSAPSGGFSSGIYAAAAPAAAPQPPAGNGGNGFLAESCDPQALADAQRRQSAGEAAAAGRAVREANDLAARLMGMGVSGGAAAAPPTPQQAAYSGRGSPAPAPPPAAAAPAAAAAFPSDEPPRASSRASSRASPSPRAHDAPGRHLSALHGDREAAGSRGAGSERPPSPEGGGDDDNDDGYGDGDPGMPAGPSGRRAGAQSPFESHEDWQDEQLLRMVLEGSLGSPGAAAGAGGREPPFPAPPKGRTSSPDLSPVKQGDGGGAPGGWGGRGRAGAPPQSAASRGPKSLFAPTPKEVGGSAGDGWIAHISGGSAAAAAGSNGLSSGGGSGRSSSAGDADGRRSLTPSPPPGSSAAKGVVRNGRYTR